MITNNHILNILKKHDKARFAKHFMIYSKNEQKQPIRKQLSKPIKQNNKIQDNQVASCILLFCVPLILIQTQL
jgi:hypothetical protein